MAVSTFKLVTTSNEMANINKFIYQNEYDCRLKSIKPTSMVKQTTRVLLVNILGNIYKKDIDKKPAVMYAYLFICQLEGEFSNMITHTR